MNTPLFGFLGFLGPLISLAIIILIIAGAWKTFEKGGQPGWGCLIPIYNLYCLIKIAGKDWWWLLLFLIPLVNIIMAFLVLLGVASNFGKSFVFALGLFFLPFIFYPILGFGDATYGAKSQPATA